MEDERTAMLAWRLRRAGLRATRPRILVLDFLERSHGHRSVDEILEALTASGARLPRATVYNVVRSLVSAGLLMVADAGPGRMLLEAARIWHHHFVCRECGAVLDVPCVVGAKPCLEPDLPGAEVDEAQIIWRGRCPACVAHDQRGGGDGSKSAEQPRTAGPNSARSFAMMRVRVRQR